MTSEPKTAFEADHRLARAFRNTTRKLARTMRAHVSKRADHLERHSGSVLRLGDEEAIPNPFAELETGAIKNMVSDPRNKDVDDQADNIGGYCDLKRCEPQSAVKCEEVEPMMSQYDRPSALKAMTRCGMNA